MSEVTVTSDGGLISGRLRLLEFLMATPDLQTMDAFSAEALSLGEAIGGLTDPDQRARFGCQFAAITGYQAGFIMRLMERKAAEVSALIESLEREAGIMPAVYDA
jgi:hypothetical protein